MRFPVRVFLRCVSSLLIFLLLLQFFASSVFAQTQQVTQPQQKLYNTSNIAADVPRDQHTYVQSMLLEFMFAIQCQITGIDIARQGQPCLGLDLTTGKLGYAPPEAYQNGQIMGGSLLGMLNGSISMMFTPVAGSQEYIKYVASNFGIVKPAIAAPSTGFEGLSPVLELWKATRDIAYYVLIVAFIFIGIGVMLRIHIDPRTVMTVQNQIPRVIICIILITFSYALAGLLIDLMWSVTYMGINTLTATGTDPQVGCAGDRKTLSNVATGNILQSPMTYFNETFKDPGCTTGGILDLSGKVSDSMAVIQTNLLLQLFGLDGDASSNFNNWYDWINPLSYLGAAADLTFTYAIKWLIGMAWIFISLFIILISLIRIWFALLKAYAMVFLYVVLGPLWIVMGLLPKKPLGFEKWIRILFANLSVFSATAFLLIFARILTDRFSTNTDKLFVAPLVGDPGTGALGGLIGFAILLITPSILDTLREKLGVAPSKAFQGAMQTFQAGRKAPGSLIKKGWGGVYRINPTTGAAESSLAIGAQQLKGWAKKKVLGPKGPLGYGGDPDQEPSWKKFMRESSERKDNMRLGHGYRTNDEMYGRGRRVQAWAQPQVDAIILDKDKKPVKTKYDDKQWATLQDLDARGGISDSQRKIMADNILARKSSDWSTHDRKFIEAQRQNGTLTPLQEEQYKKSIASTTGAATTTAGGATGGTPQQTTFNVTVNNNVTPVSIPHGASIGSVVASLPAAAKTAFTSNPDLLALDQTLVQHLTDTQTTLFKDYLGEQMTAGNIPPTHFANPGGPTGTSGGTPRATTT